MAKTIEKVTVVKYTVELDANDVQLLSDTAKALGACGETARGASMRKLVAEITGNTLRGPYKKRKPKVESKED